MPDTTAKYNERLKKDVVEPFMKQDVDSAESGIGPIFQDMMADIIAVNYKKPAAPDSE